MISSLCLKCRVFVCGSESSSGDSNLGVLSPFLIFTYFKFWSQVRSPISSSKVDLKAVHLHRSPLVVVVSGFLFFLLYTARRFLHRVLLLLLFWATLVFFLYNFPSFQLPSYSKLVELINILHESKRPRNGGDEIEEEEDSDEKKCVKRRERKRREKEKKVGTETEWRRCSIQVRPAS